MKKSILIFGLLFVLVFGNIHAQKVTVNININNQPAWGPVGYDYARYYYFPDMDCYYDINNAMFYFMSDGYWVSSRYLPSMYHQYNLYGVYKVVINNNQPWRYYNNHRRMYAKYRGYHYNQLVIYKSKDRRYDRSRQNRYDWIAPEHRPNRKQSSETNKQHSRQQDNRYNSHRYEQGDKLSQPSNSGRNNERSKQNNRVENSSGIDRAQYNKNLRQVNNTTNSRTNVMSSERRGSGRS